MKAIRNSMALAGVSLMLLVSAVPGARAQGISVTSFSGTVTFPFQVQWGRMILPAGEYTLRYGALNGVEFVVEVIGKEKGSPHGLILAQAPDKTWATKSSLVCIREGGMGIVRSLEMSEIGESVKFMMPHGVKIMANNRNRSGYTQIAEAPALIQRLPVTMNGK